MIIIIKLSSISRPNLCKNVLGSVVGNRKHSDMKLKGKGQLNLMKIKMVKGLSSQDTTNLFVLLKSIKSDNYFPISLNSRNN